MQNVTKSLFSTVRSEIDNQLRNFSAKIDQVMVVNNAKNIEIQENINILQREKTLLDNFTEGFIAESRKERQKLEEVVDKFDLQYREMADKIEFINAKLKESYDFTRVDK